MASQSYTSKKIDYGTYTVYDDKDNSDYQLETDYDYKKKYNKLMKKYNKSIEEHKKYMKQYNKVNKYYKPSTKKGTKRKLFNKDDIKDLESKTKKNKIFDHTFHDYIIKDDLIDDDLIDNDLIDNDLIDDDLIRDDIIRDDLIRDDLIDDKDIDNFYHDYVNYEYYNKSNQNKKDITHDIKQKTYEDLFGHKQTINKINNGHHLDYDIFGKKNNLTELNVQDKTFDKVEELFIPISKSKSSEFNYDLLTPHNIKDEAIKDDDIKIEDIKDEDIKIEDIKDEVIEVIDSEKKSYGEMLYNLINKSSNIKSRVKKTQITVITHKSFEDHYECLIKKLKEINSTDLFKKSNILVNDCKIGDFTTYETVIDIHEFY